MTEATRETGAAKARPLWASLSGGCLGALLAAFLVLAYGAGVGRSFVDPDDAMRLVQVRDLMGGQRWSDLTQPRMQPPEGTPMHWSRIDDLPVVAGIAVAREFGFADPERFAMLAWPVILLVPLLAVLGLAAAGLSLPGRPSVVAVATCALACASDGLLSRFYPGRIDHHALMTTLAAFAVCGSLVVPTYGTGLAGGVAAALCLGVGFEDLGVVVAAVAVSAVAWVSGGADRPVRGLADGLVVGAVVVAVAFVPEAGRTSTACDSLSLGWVSAILVGAGGLSLAVRFASDSRSRAACLAAVGAVSAAVAFASLRPCAGGPFAALDASVVSYWLKGVSEMKDVYAATGGRLDLLAQDTVVPLLGLACLAAWVAGRDRPAGLTRVGAAGLWVVLAIATAFGFLFVRNSGLPVALAAPVVGAFVGRAYARGRTAVLRTVLALAALPFVMTGIDAAYPDADVASASARRAACATRDAWSTLAGLPRGRVLAPIDMGAYVLAFTPHEVEAGGYHRAARGLRDTVAFMTGDEAEALAVARRDDVDYVAWCRKAGETVSVPGRPTKGMAREMEEGRLPAWLRIVEAEGPVAVARVVRASSKKP